MAERVVDGVWRVDTGHVNVYLVEAEAGLVAVDAGLPSAPGTVREAIREVGWDVESLAGVLVTHADLDHVGGLAALVEDARARVHLSPRARDLVTGEASPPWTSLRGLMLRFGQWRTDPPPAERLEVVRDGDRVHGFQVLATPGHTRGHLSYVDEVRGLAFVGDLVRTEDRDPALPPGLINADTDRARRSLARLLEAADEIETACAGHGEPLRERARERLEALRG